MTMPVPRVKPIFPQPSDGSAEVWLRDLARWDATCGRRGRGRWSLTTGRPPGMRPRQITQFAPCRRQMSVSFGIAIAVLTESFRRPREHNGRVCGAIQTRLGLGADRMEAALFS